MKQKFNRKFTSAIVSNFLYSNSRMVGNVGLRIGVSIVLELVVLETSFDSNECADAENVNCRLFGTI